MNGIPQILNWITPTIPQVEMEDLFKTVNALLVQAGHSPILKFAHLKFEPLSVPKEALFIQFPFFSANTQAFKELLWNKIDEISTKPFLASVQSEESFLTKKKLVVFDMDSTFINQEVIDEIARAAGKYEDVAKITEEAMQGKLPFSESLKRRCKLLKGLSIHEVHNIISNLSLSPGAQEFTYKARSQEVKTAIISGGFDFVLRHFQKICSVDHVYANQLEQDDDEQLTGDVLPPIVDAEYKQKLVANLKKQYAFNAAETIVVGDGANDIPMMDEAAVSVSFCGKPKLNAAVNTLIFDRNLRWLELFIS